MGTNRLLSSSGVVILFCGYDQRLSARPLVGYGQALKKNTHDKNVPNLMFVYLLITLNCSAPRLVDKTEVLHCNIVTVFTYIRIVFPSILLVFKDDILIRKVRATGLYR